MRIQSKSGKFEIVQRGEAIESYNTLDEAESFVNGFMGVQVIKSRHAYVDGKNYRRFLDIMSVA